MYFRFSFPFAHRPLSPVPHRRACVSTICLSSLPAVASLARRVFASWSHRQRFVAAVRRHLHNGSYQRLSAFPVPTPSTKLFASGPAVKDLAFEDVLLVSEYSGGGDDDAKDSRLIGVCDEARHALSSDGSQVLGSDFSLTVDGRRVSKPPAQVCDSECELLGLLQVRCSVHVQQPPSHLTPNEVSSPAPTPL